jgi:hypothetical protein
MRGGRRGRGGRASYSRGVAQDETPEKYRPRALYPVRVLNHLGTSQSLTSPADSYT